jgi:hypothetical protein
VVKGPGPDDCDFFTGAIGTHGCGRFYVSRAGSGICVRPHRYALARWLTVPLGPADVGLPEFDMPLCVKVCGADAPRRYVVIGDQGHNIGRRADALWRRPQSDPR